MKAYFVRLCLMTCLFLLISPQLSYATHAYGASLYYTCQNACTYSVYVETIYDCYSSATPLPPSVPTATSVYFSGPVGSCSQPTALSGWLLDSYVEVTPICPTDSTRCGSPNALIGGSLVAIFHRDYNFCGPGFCNNYVVNWSTCCRSTGITSGGAGTNMYLETEIDLTTSPCNNSPVFAYPPVTHVCSGTGSVFSQAAIDEDGDSLVYSLVACKGALGAPINYTAGYSALNPMGSAWQVSIDAQTGALSLLPSPGGMTISPFCIQVDEYRNGAHIGSINREMIVIVFNCSAGNILPQLDSLVLVQGGNQTGAASYEMAIGASLQIDLLVSDGNAAQSLDLVLPKHIGNISRTVSGSNPASIRFQFTPQAQGTYAIPLMIQDDACSIVGSTVGQIQVRVNGPTIPPVQDSIITDAVHASIWSDGSLFWDPRGGNGLLMPKDSAISLARAAGLWIGGRDASGQLRLSAHGQDKLDRGVSDFWAGPLTNGAAATDSATVTSFNQIWHISQAEVDAFLLDFNDNGVVDFPANYPNVYSWPAFGTDAGGNNVSAVSPTGSIFYLAPFVDMNGNAADYNPNQGDHPAIKGDQMYWWIYNDQSPTHDPRAASMGLEVHVTAFAYDCPDSLDKNNSLFFEYTLINRSNTTIHDTYLGFWTDGELGNPMDDYSGVDSTLNLYYFYNGDSDDENHFDRNPPALGVGLLQGPLADPNDGLDNDQDQIIDELGETWRMDGFMSFNKGASGINGQPTQAAHYDRYLRSFWQDSMPLIDNYRGGVGSGNGYTPLSGSLRSRTMFNGNACIGQDWTEKNAGIPGGDRQALGSMGPFTLAAGAVHHVSMHYSWARAFFQDEIGSVCEMLKKQKYMQRYFQNGYQNCGYYYPPVHPGDANFDQVANNMDLLAIGINYGKTGPYRIGNSNQWIPQNVINWGDTLANGADIKHSDCDGQGVIDTFDVTPILLNYGMTHTFSKTSGAGSPLFMIPPTTTFSGGDTARIPIHWGDMNDPLTHAYGIAFSITYDSSKVEKAWVEFSPSWLATPGSDLLGLYKDLPHAQKIDVGISRNDQVNRMGYGRIADLIIVMDDDLNKRVLPMTLGIEQAFAISNAEEEIPLGTQDATINLETAIDHGLQSRISLFPNPTRDRLYIDGLKAAECQNISLYDVNGRSQELKIEKQQTLIHVSLDPLSPGFYLLEIQTASGKATFKVVKQP